MTKLRQKLTRAARTIRERNKELKELRTRNAILEIDYIELQHVSFALNQIHGIAGKFISNRT